MSDLLARLQGAIVRAANGTTAFVRANRTVVISGFTVLGILLIVWARLGFTFEIGRFFASFDEEVSDGGGGGECPISGTTCNGNIIWEHSIACGQSGPGEDCAVSGKVCQNNNGSPTVIGATCVAPGGGGGGVPSDPTGACVWKTNFNAPEGAWFCKSLQCPLDGNPSGGQEYPPAGPASNLAVKVFRTLDETVNPADGPIHVRTVLDGTPKCSNGKECYPPKDPLWTCTGPMYQGRDGSDFYDCYNPIIHRTNYGPITCCANTGLAGDCFTWDLAAPPGASVSPVVSPTGTPTTTVSPVTSVNAVTCAPATQTVAVNTAATLQASGGTGEFRWISEGQSATGASISFTFTTTGTKVVTVTSGSATASCLVTVQAAATASPTPTPAAVDLTLAMTGLNASTGSAEGTLVNAIGGNHVEIVLRVRSTAGTDDTRNLQDVSVRATLPGGLSYLVGSTSINGITTSTETITTSGLTLGTLTPGQETVVRFRALVDGNAFPIGSSQAVINATASATGISAKTGQVTVVVTRATAGEVPTGPGGATLVALLVSAIATLLYVSYTNSSAFRRHELERIGKERDPLDFK